MAPILPRGYLSNIYTLALVAPPMYAVKAPQDAEYYVTYSIVGTSYIKASPEPAKMAATTANTPIYTMKMFRVDLSSPGGTIVVA
ncbi:MAG: hypothetical protein QXK88_06815 [Desulfurococcaceae archaeon]